MQGAVYAAKSFAEAWQPLALLLWLLPPLVRPPSSYYKFIQVQSDMQLRGREIHCFALLRKLWNFKFKRKSREMKVSRRFIGVIIDHGHFQYNCVCLGLSLAAAGCVAQKHIVPASAREHSTCTDLHLHRILLMDEVVKHFMQSFYIFLLLKFPPFLTLQRCCRVNPCRESAFYPLLHPRLTFD